MVIDKLYEDVLKIYDVTFVTDFYIRPKRFAIYFQNKVISISDIEWNDEIYDKIIKELIEKYKRVENIEIKNLKARIAEKSINFATFINNIRTRVHIFLSADRIIAVLRLLDRPIMPLDSIGFSQADIEKITGKGKGLILISGPTGSGKTTTATSLVEWYNRNKEFHIISVEDPIEYLMDDKTSIVHQKEIKVDVASFQNALTDTLREKAHLIFVGEIISHEAADLVFQTSSTGQLVISTIHAGDSIETIDRFIGLFDRKFQELVRKNLGEFLNCIVNQRLVFINNKPLLLYEILMADQSVKAVLRQPTAQITLLQDNLIRQKQVPIEKQIKIKTDEANRLNNR